MQHHLDVGVLLKCLPLRSGTTFHNFVLVFELQSYQQRTSLIWPIVSVMRQATLQLKVMFFQARGGQGGTWRIARFNLGRHRDASSANCSF